MHYLKHLSILLPPLRVHDVRTLHRPKNLVLQSECCLQPILCTNVVRQMPLYRLMCIATSGAGTTCLGQELWQVSCQPCGLWPCTSQGKFIRVCHATSRSQHARSMGIQALDASASYGFQARYQVCDGGATAQQGGNHTPQPAWQGSDGEAVTQVRSKVEAHCAKL